MFKIKLEHFEGPLDLLLFFIKRDELDIYDIPIAKITKEFLDYVNLIKIMDLESAGDFILMASTLMHIKVRMLLPKEVDDRGEEIDPRADLVKALLEYKKYKEVSEELAFFETNQRKINYRSNFEEDYKIAPPEFETLLKNVTIFHLAKVFSKAIQNIKPETVHQIIKTSVTIDEQIDFINKKLAEFPELHFLTLVAEIKEKIRIIVTFIALLELVKMGKIRLKTSFNENDFVILNKQ